MCLDENEKSVNLNCTFIKVNASFIIDEWLILEMEIIHSLIDFSPPLEIYCSTWAHATQQ